MLNLNIDYEKYNIAPNKKGKILCRIRDKEVNFTPEEKVRQGLLHYLIEEMQVPEDMIAVEYPIDNKNFVDIVVVYTDEKNGEDYALLLIECKAEYINLDYKYREITNQLARYHRLLYSNYVAITNGYQIEILRIAENIDFLEKIPTYQEMLRDEVEVVPEITDFSEFVYERCPADKLGDVKFLDENYGHVIGEETPDILKPFLVNFNDALQDGSIRIEPCKFKNFEIIEDSGIINSSYGTPGGGTYEGSYRSFSIRDYKGNNLAVNILLTAFFRKKYDEYYMFSPYLIVGIDSDNLNHSCLQVGMNKSVKKISNQFVIKHNGRVTVGRGSVSPSLLKSYLSENRPEFFHPEELRLGVIKNNGPLSMENLEMKNFILATIEYTMFRYHFKKQYRS